MHWLLSHTQRSPYSTNAEVVNTDFGVGMLVTRGDIWLISLLFLGGPLPGISWIWWYVVRGVNLIEGTHKGGLLVVVSSPIRQDQKTPKGRVLLCQRIDADVLLL
jgi:hypothetical protein